MGGGGPDVSAASALASANARSRARTRPTDATRRDVPVHLVAGRHDGVIPPGNVQQHYRAMRAAGVDVSYREVCCL
jgi:predicted esterase